MTAHEPARRWPEPAHTPHFAAGRIIRPLSWLMAMTLVAAAASFLLSGHRLLSWSLAVHLAGMTGLVTASLLLAALGLTACLGMILARRRDLAMLRATAGSTTRPAAEWPQSVLTLLFSTAAACAVLLDWPQQQTVVDPLNAPSGFIVASGLLLLATPWLLAERYVATVRVDWLPEIDDLRALLFLPVVFLGAEAVWQVAASFGFGALHWPRVIQSVILLLVCLELALRTFATWFLPPRDSIAARAPIKSLLAGILQGRALSPVAMADVVRSQFGMDFSRSWALRFMRATAVPVALLMLAFCWFLTGVTRIDLNQRGSYERFGVAAAMLQPGLHLVLPWPFGAVRHGELGVIHTALIRYEDQDVTPDAADTSIAEGDAPSGANRLWDKEQPSDVSYIIASSEQNRQSFQTVSVSVRVLYRTGLDDAAARAALYREADPGALVHALASRMLAQFFALQTLPKVLGENQAVIATDVRTRLQQALDSMGSGIDIVSVVIEAIHPPSGAATAYRNVQAAEIEATTSIATERGRAQTTDSVARRDAHGATNDASATAAETISAAQVDLTDITADDRPYQAASRPFVLERYFSDVRAALANVPLLIVDHRLADSSPATIDLRPAGMIRDGADTHLSRDGDAGGGRDVQGDQSR